MIMNDYIEDTYFCNRCKKQFHFDDLIIGTSSSVDDDGEPIVVDDYFFPCCGTSIYDIIDD